MDTPAVNELDVTRCLIDGDFVPAKACATF